MRKKWQIANVELKNQIVAAPLAGISNPVYRSLMHRNGAALVVSEMISDKALHYKSERTFAMCETVDDEHPVSLQLFGSDVDTMAEAAEYLSMKSDCDIIDINMGCPVHKVVKTGAGSALLQDPLKAKQIAEVVVRHTHKPVTVKIRSGWDSQHINAVEVALALQDAGVAAIAIHGRTRAQMYSGGVDLEIIKKVKEAVSIPVIGNGDIKSVEDGKNMLEKTGVDAIMIGRGLLGKPYFIQEMIAYLDDEEYHVPSIVERLRMLEEYTVKLINHLGEYPAMQMMKGMSAWYLTGMPNSAQVRKALSSVDTLHDLQSILNEYRQVIGI